MKEFTKLCLNIDQTTKTNQKVAYLVDYFKIAEASDSAWAVYFLFGKKLKKSIQSKILKKFTLEVIDIPEWLFTECKLAVGETAETIALLFGEDEQKGMDITLNNLITEIIIPLTKKTETEQRNELIRLWKKLSIAERFVVNKILSGHFRLGVSKKLVMRALAKVANVDIDIIALRTMGNWSPTKDFFLKLIDPKNQDETPIARPYPFHLAYPLDKNLIALGEVEDISVEWKWDGIRCQLIKRDNQIFLWSRGEDLITEQFPEIVESGKLLSNGVVLDGEILVWSNSKVESFNKLQTRLGRKKISKELLKEYPVKLLCYDILEYDGVDIRGKTLINRHEILRNLLPKEFIEKTNFLLSKKISFSSWSELNDLIIDSRKNKVEGFMLKANDSPYVAGRKKGYWWKWKIEPFTADAVLIYAQKGSGRRAGLFTDYTFAIWKDDELVPFAKAYSGLTNEEIKEINSFVKKNTTDKFGPVRRVTPKLVFEIAFEGIQESKRHKSGIAVRFPRILRIRRDKNIEDADSIETLISLIEK